MQKKFLAGAFTALYWEQFKFLNQAVSSNQTVISLESYPYKYSRITAYLLKLFSFTIVLASALLLSKHAYAQSFRVVNFGDDVLAVGAGARALGMGSAFSALSDDLTAAYWNPASLVRSQQPRQIAYMHSERFGGAVAYDYAAYSQDLKQANKPSRVAISFFRQGVDGIKNTINAWDAARGLPRPDPEQYFSSFSASDMAVLLSYARQQSDRLSLGGNVRILHSRLGPFANGTGYSLDLSLFYRSNLADLALQVQNATGLLKFWTVNRSEFEGFEDFGQEIPEGQNEFIRPSIRMGIARSFKLKHPYWVIRSAFDTQLRFNNQRAFYLNAGPMSIEPHWGMELDYRSLLFARFGLTDFVTNFDAALSVSPTIGAGLHIGRIQVDYAFASFAGPTVDLGYTHRISLIASF